MFSIYASKTFCSSCQCNPLSQAAFYTDKQDSSATSMDTLGKMLTYVSRGMNQPQSYLEMKFQKTYTSHVGNRRVCVRVPRRVSTCICTRTEPSLWDTATVAPQLLFSYIHGCIMALTRAAIIREFQRYNGRPHKRWLVLANTGRPGPELARDSARREPGQGRGQLGRVGLGRAGPAAPPEPPPLMAPGSARPCDGTGGPALPGDADGHPAPAGGEGPRAAPGSAQPSPAHPSQPPGRSPRVLPGRARLCCGMPGQVTATPRLASPQPAGQPAAAARG